VGSVFDKGGSWDEMNLLVREPEGVEDAMEAERVIVSSQMRRRVARSSILEGLVEVFPMVISPGSFLKKLRTSSDQVWKLAWIGRQQLWSCGGAMWRSYRSGSCDC